MFEIIGECGFIDRNCLASIVLDKGGSRGSMGSEGRKATRVTIGAYVVVKPGTG